MRCPICKKEVPDAAEKRPTTYPFCSERCKLVDLGRWLSGRYQIPVEDQPAPPDPGARGSKEEE